MFKKPKKPWKQLSMKFDQYNKDGNDEQIKTSMLDGDSGNEVCLEPISTN